MKRNLYLGVLIGFCFSTMIYLSASYFYEDLILYVFNIKNKDEIDFMNEKEEIIKLFIKDLNNIDKNNREKIDSLAEEHFFNQFSNYKILNYPSADGGLVMFIIPIDEKFNIIYVNDNDINSYINIKFSLE